MSFLLDALRKSETSRRRREAPTIHSPAPAPAPAGRDSDWLPLVLLLAPSFLFMSWMGLDQYGTFSGPTAPVSQVTGQESGAGAPAAVPVEGRVEAEPERVAGNGGRVAGEPVAAPERGRRTPVERAPVPAPTRTTPPPAQSSPRQMVSEPAGTEPAATDNAGSLNQSRPAAKPPAPAPRKNHIDYWDLPGNVRGQLPEFRINVLVYADDPAERFVLVNGQRQYEGDELQPGLVLDEIRRDGAIYTFRRYRFLVGQ